MLFCTVLNIYSHSAARSPQHKRAERSHLILARPFTISNNPDDAPTKYRSHTQIPNFINHPSLAYPRHHESLRKLKIRTGGGERVRTDDLRLAKPALSQLSYTPFAKRKANQQVSLTALEEANKNPLAKTNHLSSDVVGLGRFELPTSRLSGVRSNPVSYTHLTLPTKA